jgi:hypothetical protein
VLTIFDFVKNFISRSGTQGQVKSQVSDKKVNLKTGYETHLKKRNLGPSFFEIGFFFVKCVFFFFFWVGKFLALGDQKQIQCDSSCKEFL